MLVGALAVYICLQLCVVWVVSRRIKTDDDYFLAGRKLGPTLVTLSVFATWFGAETCVGSSGAIYQGGLYSSRADPFGYTICLLLMGGLLAVPLWKRRMTTLADFFRHHYQSVAVEKLAIFLLLPISIVWASAQIKAFGHVLSNVSEVPVEVGMGIAAGVVVVYTFWGGLLGDVVTDLIQGIVLIVGLIFLFIVALIHFNAQGLSFESIDPQRLSFVQPGASWMSRVDLWMIPILGSLVTQELFQKVVAARSPGVARGSCYMGAFLYLGIGLIPVTIGLMGPYVVAGVEDPDKFLITVAAQRLPAALYIIFAGALISAILSTVDSTLLAISAFTTHNLLGHFYYERSEKARLLIARLTVFAAGSFALAVAMYGGGVYDLVLSASSLGTSGLLVVMFMSLYAPKVGTKYGAIACLVVGAVALPLWEKVEAVSAPYLTAIATCLMVYLFVSWVTKAKQY